MTLIYDSTFLLFLGIAGVAAVRAVQHLNRHRAWLWWAVMTLVLVASLIYAVMAVA